MRILAFSDWRVQDPDLPEALITHIGDVDLVVYAGDDVARLAFLPPSEDEVATALVELGASVGGTGPARPYTCDLCILGRVPKGVTGAALVHYAGDSPPSGVKVFAHAPSPTRPAVTLGTRVLDARASILLLVDAQGLRSLLGRERSPRRVLKAWAWLYEDGGQGPVTPDLAALTTAVDGLGDVRLARWMRLVHPGRRRLATAWSSSPGAPASGSPA